MARSLIAGFVSDSGRLAALVSPLAARGVKLEPRRLALEAVVAAPVDVVLVDAAALDVTPQHLSQRIRVWGMLPFVAVAPRFELAAARVWQSLGALELVAQDDPDRLALVLEQLERRHRAASSDLLQTVI